MKQNEEQGTEVAVPHLAESLVSATVGKWLKQPGDYVREYDVLCELITDKVNVEMPSPIEGTLQRILVLEGESADVGSAICIIMEPEAARENADDEHSGQGEQEQKERPGQDGQGDLGGRFSPAVLRLAKELKVELSQVRGTGLGGRITRKDVLAYAKNLETAGDAKPPEPERAGLPPQKREEAEKANGGKTSASGAKGDETIAVSPIRNVIASRMRQSVTEIPHAWMMIEADVTQMVALRNRLKDRFLSKEGVNLTYTPFVLKAIVNAIKDVPMMNSTWNSDTITIKKDVHICIAIGSEQSVVTPVLRHADRKTIAGLAVELDGLVKRARAGALTLADMQGGTFTFNNTGAYGSVLSYPIINYPQAAIITFESIVRRPAVVNDGIAIRSMANLCLSLDHRILDGMICGRFMQRVKHYVEQFDPDSAIY